MNLCTAMRWRIPEFLNGNLPSDMMEEMREHLDVCPDCAVVLAHPARVESGETKSSVELSEDFTERLLEQLPISFTGHKLAYLVALALVASGIFGVAIWAGIKKLLGGSRELIDVAATASANDTGGLLGSLFSYSTLQYLGVGLLAVVICFVVIAVVDGPLGGAKSLRNESS